MLAIKEKKRKLVPPAIPHPACSPACSDLGMYKPLPVAAECQDSSLTSGTRRVPSSGLGDGLCFRSPAVLADSKC